MPSRPSSAPTSRSRCARTTAAGWGPPTRRPRSWSVARGVPASDHRTRRARRRSRLRRRRPRRRGRHLRALSRAPRPDPRRADVRPAAVGGGAPAAGASVLRAGFGALPVPPEEARLGGVRHSKERDAAAISHHYDVSNDFYRIVLGPSMTYSCAVWEREDVTLEDAQAAKYELICRKLGLEPGMRLLDVGCGWGGMVLHAAAAPRRARGRRHALAAPGRLGREARSPRRGSPTSVEIRFQDYRDVDDGPFDAISSIGMFEHVGLSQLRRVLRRCSTAAAPRRPAAQPRHRRPAEPGAAAPRFQRRTASSTATCSPTASCTRSGSVVSAIQGSGVRGPARREPARALRAHAAGVGAQPRGDWDEAVADVGAGPGARVAPLHGRLGAELRGRPDPGAPGPRRPVRRRPLGAAAASEVRGPPAAALTGSRYGREVPSTREGRCPDRSCSSATTP